VPEVAKATGPRFCDGGADAEKQVVRAELLNRLENGGWNLCRGIDRIWYRNTRCRRFSQNDIALCFLFCE
jgi:hypothetical protein